MGFKSVADGALKGLATVAPWIATALGGPLAGSAIGAAEKAFGVAPGAFKTAQDVVTALAGGTPEQQLALKQADNDFALHMQQLGFENLQKLEEISAADRDSARKREEVVRDWTPRILAYGITTGFFGILWYMLMTPLPPSSHDALLLLLGALQTAWVGVVTYYFGSSSGSDAKTSILANRINNDEKANQKVTPPN